MCGSHNFFPDSKSLYPITSTTCGTTLADFADRSLGIGYPGGSLLLLVLVLMSLLAWYKALGTVDRAMATPRIRGLEHLRDDIELALRLEEESP